MTLLITVNNKTLCNNVFTNVINKVILSKVLSIVVVSRLALGLPKLI
jgi:hypothetical protein